MKQLVYKILGYTEVYNYKTNTVEQQESIATVSTNDISEENIEIIKEITYNGEYTIEDDNVEEY